MGTLLSLPLSLSLLGQTPHITHAMRSCTQPPIYTYMNACSRPPSMPCNAHGHQGCYSIHVLSHQACNARMCSCRSVAVRGGDNTDYLKSLPPLPPPHTHTRTCCPWKETWTTSRCAHCSFWPSAPSFWQRTHVTPATCCPATRSLRPRCAYERGRLKGGGGG